MINILRNSNHFNRNLIKHCKKYFSIIGIDIGGTNTCMAILEPSGPRVIENAEGLRTTPSYISYQEGSTENDVLIGVNSKKLAVQLTKSTFFGSRHFFSLDKISINSLVDKKRFPFDIELNKETTDIKSILYKNPFGSSLNPIEQTGKFLKYCKEQADGLLGKNIKKAVVSVPNNLMNSTSQGYISSALDTVGIKAVSFIDESKASILAYNQTSKSNILVFNLGGTGFSLTYLTKTNNTELKENNKTENDNKEIEELSKFEILQHHSNCFLGGDDIDMLVSKHLVEEFEKKNRADPTKEVSAMQRIREAAEIAKTELSSSNQVEINLPFLMADHKGPKHLQLSISKPKFERLVDSFIQKVKTECEDFKAKCVDIDKVDDILMVGGMCRSPFIQELIKSVFKKEPNRSINPEEAGAIGACILADSYNKKGEEKVDFSKLPLSIGVETLGGVFSRLISKGSELPISKTFKISTVYDNQPTINVKLYMGERALCEDNRLIGDINMLVPLHKKGKITVEVNVKCNDSGFLQVKLFETLSKKTTLYSVDLANGLTTEIIDDVLSIGDKFKEVDEYRLNNSQLRSQIDDFLYTVSNEIIGLKDKTQEEDKAHKIDVILEKIRNLNVKVGSKDDNQTEVIDLFNDLKRDVDEITKESLI